MDKSIFTCSRKTVGVGVVLILVVIGVIYSRGIRHPVSSRSLNIKEMQLRKRLERKRQTEQTEKTATVIISNKVSVTQPENAAITMRELEMRGTNDEARMTLETVSENNLPTQQPLQRQAKRACDRDNSAINLAEVKSSAERQQAVVNAFCHAWKGYKSYSWGADELAPVSQTQIHWFGLGITIIDSLDTMWIMKLTDEFHSAREWVANNLNFNQAAWVNLFETTIRVLGGLLSAYHLSQDDLFKAKAIDLGDRLLPAFRSPSGIPYSDVNLQHGTGATPSWATISTTSEATTVQLEFRDLSRITGKKIYQTTVDQVLNVLHQQPVADSLLPIFVSPITGKFDKTAAITLGARGDSYYEYLLKQWLQCGKKESRFRDWYVESMDGAQRKLIQRTKPHSLLFVGELQNGIFSPKMDHLVCFLAGTLALGAHNNLTRSHMDIAKELMYTCVQMYERMETGLSPEIVYFNQDSSKQEDIRVQPADTHNLLRPETVESLFILYRLTRNKTYQEWGWKIFQAFEKYTRVQSGGYSSIADVRSPEDPQYKDKMESFFLGETLKYLYLLFEEDFSVISLDEFVFNTEAHPLPIWT
ncbi:endoplasmic reticulum mannosyl-oligosaccharide 1,2-alpha-mannosidase-like isoform X2 [Corticium candelabrum]|uniref:endoplasmic reticulum mannosyl-oligosaccharide 1,2-alpha-mannosidase-like isoform X2 n=1 Tax=Corticium candelabrum TaxID=121492 RepID=UPI002E260C12|nr:endoplasmic reticulum mannosyl-oligosaccharide 1,2-alpha-mannosidase-like isoform X2 [Corticium candelabrum]